MPARTEQSRYATRLSPVVVEAEVDLERPPDEVFDFCCDPTREPEWNPMMKQVVKLTDGPVRVGARYQTEFAEGPRMVMECIRHEPPSAWSFAGDSRVLKAVGEGRVVPTSRGSHLAMRMELHPQGLLKAAAPLLRRRMGPMFQRDVENIRALLEGADSREDAFGRDRVSESDHPAAVDLYWLPLGAGGHCVRLNGRAFEALSAGAQHRRPSDLYHTALEVRLGQARYVIEMAPVWNEHTRERGVLAEGAVGHRLAGRSRLFRYEIRRWRDGRIPDVDEAVESPCRLSSDPATARRLLGLVADVPTAVWGRDELEAGEMWNSNSLTSWLITRSGIDPAPIQPPVGGRAPGWQAGLVVARRHFEPAAVGLRTECVGHPAG